MSEPKLKRNLSFISMIALSSGAVIGGWLAEAPYWFSVTGAGAAFIFPLLALLLIPVGLTFAELTSMLPFAASVDVWTTNALGHKAGFGTQWMMFLVQVVEPPMMAFIFITAADFFAPGLIPPSANIWVAIATAAVWYILSNFNVELTGKLANIFFFAMIIGSLIVSFSMFTSGHWSAANLTAKASDGTGGGLFPNGFYGVFIALAVFSLKFIGFEMTPTMVEETNFPVSKIWKVILSALFVPALLYFIVVMAIGGMAPADQIAAMGMPEPEIVALYGMMPIIAWISVLCGVLHAFTTLMGFWSSAARVLYGAAEMNQLPKAFARLNNYGQPALANTVVLLFTIFFCIFSGDNWVQYIYAVSCIAAGIVYFMCCLDAMILRRKHPEWKRPYKAPMGNLMFVLGMVISVWVVIGSCLELDLGGYVSLIAYCAVGVALYAAMGAYRKSHPAGNELRTFTPEDIAEG